MRIGLLGGSFNPPHNGHLNIALEIINNNLVDKVIYIPSILNVCHNKLLASKEDRFNMTKLLIEGYSNLEVSDVEIRKEVQNYSYQTLDHFKILYPEDEIILIIGSDNLKEIERWRKYLYILKNYKIIVFRRDNDNINEIINNIEAIKEFKDNITYFNYNIFDYISSTLIRNKLSKLEDISSLIPIKILNYIKERDLYNENSSL